MSQKNHVPSPTSFPLPAGDGFPLAAWRWEPAGETIGNVGVVHGLGEHSGRYEEVAQQLSAAGYRVITFDQRGHGVTAGKRGHVAQYSILLDDMDSLIGHLERAEPALPRFLYGHSLGGNLVLNHALRRQPQLSGLIVSSPLLEPTTAPPSWKRSMAQLLDHFWPSLTLNTGVKAQDLSHDPEAVTRRRSDPLVHSHVSVRLAIQMLDAGRWALEHASELAYPLFLMHGDEDKITSPVATRTFAARVQTPCELYIAERGYHELHREADREETLRRVIAWLEAHRQRV